MGDRGEISRYLENWQDEVDSAAEYRAMGAAEPDPRLAKVYANLAAMEETHIAFWEKRCRLRSPAARPSGALACRTSVAQWGDPSFRSCHAI